MFFPLGDDNRGLGLRPWVVYGLIAACGAAWWRQLNLGEAFTLAFAAVPYEITHGIDLTGPTTAIIAGHAVDLPQYPGPKPIQLTLLTSLFLHGSWMHLLGNMLYLWIFGDQIEDFLGRMRFLLFYLGCGMIAGLAQIFGNGDAIVPTLGASGAIAGVLGAYVAKYPRNAVRVLFFFQVIRVPAILVLGIWFAAQILSQAGQPSGQQGGVAYLAHIGGFAAGFFLIHLLPPRHGYRGAST